MRVDRLARETRKEGGAVQLHEAGQHDEIGFIRGDSVRESAIPVGALGEVPHAQDERRDARVAGPVQCEDFTPVGADGHDLRAVAGVASRIEQRLQVRATARNEHDETRGHWHHHSVSRP